MNPSNVPWPLLAASFWMLVFSPNTFSFQTVMSFRYALACFTFCFVVLTSSSLPLQSVRFHVNSWLPARSIVLETLVARQSVDPSGEILVLNKFCPVSWKFLSPSPKVCIIFEFD